MANISAVVSELKDSRAKLLQAIDGLSRCELTEIPIYEDWTIKDMLAHVLGWDWRVLNTLPLMLQNRASEVASVEVDDYNQESIKAGREKSLAEIMVEVQATHRQILDIIAELDPKEVDMRRERNERIITIRSYVIDVMTEHDHKHTAEIELWRRDLEQRLDPADLRARLAQSRADFWATITGLNQSDLLNQNAVDGWSVKDIVGHMADWEQFMLGAALHIHDPSLPGVLPLSEDENQALATRRAGDSWDKTVQDLIEVQQAVEIFVANLKIGDWSLRGPYPWPNDAGSLAELLDHMILHYTDHIPDLQNWRNQTMPER